jgi:hypothetical protein
MIIDDEGDYISGSGLGADIPYSSADTSFTLTTMGRDNVECGADSLDDAMEWLSGIMAQCPIGVFKAEIWDCLTYKLIFTAEDHIKVPHSRRTCASRRPRLPSRDDDGLVRSLLSLNEA